MTKQDSQLARSVRPRRSGVSLIETIACVVIVAALSSSLVAAMRSTQRSAALAAGESGAHAQGRAVLRRIAQRAQSWSRGGGVDIVNVRSNRWDLSDGSNETFRLQNAASGTGRDLVLIQNDGQQLVLVENNAVRFLMQPRQVGGNLVGMDVQLQIRESDTLSASRLQPSSADATITTTVCFSPQL
ncbi:MAG: hypothetical protein AAGD07_02775 [Planctomycetota bacterium]